MGCTVAAALLLALLAGAHAWCDRRGAAVRLCSLRVRRGRAQQALLSAGTPGTRRAGSAPGARWRRPALRRRPPAPHQGTPSLSLSRRGAPGRACRSTGPRARAQVPGGARQQRHARRPGRALRGAAVHAHVPPRLPRRRRGGARARLGSRPPSSVATGSGPGAPEGAARAAGRRPARGAGAGRARGGRACGRAAAGAAARARGQRADECALEPGPPGPARPAAGRPVSLHAGRQRRQCVRAGHGAAARRATAAAACAAQCATGRPRRRRGGARRRASARTMWSSSSRPATGRPGTRARAHPGGRPRPACRASPGAADAAPRAQARARSAASPHSATTTRTTATGTARTWPASWAGSRSASPRTSRSGPVCVPPARQGAPCSSARGRRA